MIKLVKLKKKRLKILISFFLLFGIFNVETTVSQSSHIIDSVKNLINNTPEDDTLKAKYINDLAWRIKFSNPDTTLLLLDQSEELSNKLDFADGLGNSYNTRAIIFTVQGEFDKALEYYHLAIEQFDRINDPHGVAFCIGNIAVMYNFQSNFDSSIYYNLEALRIRKENGLEKEVAKSNINIGVIYFDKGYYETSLKYYLDALNYYENMPDKGDIDFTYLGTVYSNLGNVYQELNKLDKAQNFYEKAIDLYIKFGDKRELSSIYNNLGDIEIMDNRPDNALSYYLNAYSLSKEIDERQINLISCANLANYYTDISKYDSANFYFNEGLTIGNDINDKKHTIRLYISSGQIFKLKRELNKSIEQYKKALQISEKAGIIKYKDEIYLALSEIFEKLNQKAKALEYYKFYSIAKDSVLNAEIHRQIADMEARYETAQKDKEIALQNLELEKQQILISKQKARQNLFIAGLVILLLLLGFIVFWFIQKKKHREELYKRQLEEQKQKEQLKAIKQSLESGEQERVLLADQLHDEVAPLLISFRNSIAEIEKQFPDVPVFKRIANNISVVHTEIRNISHMLYPLSVSGDNFADSLINYIQKFEHANSIKTVHSISEIDKINQITQAVQDFTYRCVQELLNNVVKHAEASEIKVEIDHKDRILYLTVVDNGKGIGEISDNDGIGLKRIKKGLKVIGGNMQMKNMKTNGVTVTIEIPVASETSVK